MREEAGRDNNKFIVKHETNYLFSNSLKTIFLGRIFISVMRRGFSVLSLLGLSFSMPWLLVECVGLTNSFAGDRFGLWLIEFSGVLPCYSD